MAARRDVSALMRAGRLKVEGDLSLFAADEENFRSRRGQARWRRVNGAGSPKNTFGFPLHSLLVSNFPAAQVDFLFECNYSSAAY